jgi:shikimate kinase
MKNIVLVGFMGTGKTAVAKLLAKRLHLRYVSTDDLIEEKEKRPISEIFSGKGESYFREVEKEAVKEVSGIQNAVIDAGGGVVISDENMANLKKTGTVVCLEATPEAILARTKRHTHRPLLNVSDPLVQIRELLAFRKPFYERADHRIDTSGLSVEGVAERIERIAKDV